MAVGRLVPAAVSPAVRALLDQAVWLIELQLTDAGQATEESLRQHCSAALARTAEIERSSELDPASVLITVVFLQNVCSGSEQLLLGVTRN
jgi:hypothetical protein